MIVAELLDGGSPVKRTPLGITGPTRRLTDAADVDDDVTIGVDVDMVGAIAAAATAAAFFIPGGNDGPRTGNVDDDDDDCWLIVTSLLLVDVDVIDGGEGDDNVVNGGNVDDAVALLVMFVAIYLSHTASNKALNRTNRTMVIIATALFVLCVGFQQPRWDRCVMVF
jgi:hypothetical protein